MNSLSARLSDKFNKTSTQYDSYKSYRTRGRSNKRHMAVFTSNSVLVRALPITTILCWLRDHCTKYLIQGTVKLKCIANVTHCRTDRRNYVCQSACLSIALV